MSALNLDALLALAGPQAELTADGAGTPCLQVPSEQWVPVLTAARDDLGCDFFDWLSAVDQTDGDPSGVDVVVHVLRSSAPAQRLLVRTRVPDAGTGLPSLTGVWRGAAWHERETFEMFGVEFTGFDDGTGAGLRPLLLPDGFEGTPLRKSFVLTARVSKPWPGAKDPGEGGDRPARAPRRRMGPPGVPDPEWGPHEPESASIASGESQGEASGERA